MANKRFAAVFCGLALLLTACNTNMKKTDSDSTIHPPRGDAAPLATRDAPPVAPKKPWQVQSPNGAREDEYYWLRDDKRENAEMLAYLTAENAYADRMLAHLKPL